MTFLSDRGNDLSGGEGSTRGSRESQGDITHMSMYKGKADIHSAAANATRASVPCEVAPRIAPIRILRLAQVIDVTGLGKTKLYELQAQGRFPMSVRITAHSVGWVEQEVQAWLSARLAERKPLPAAAVRFTQSPE
jgi:prophage regulatory protein